MVLRTRPDTRQDSRGRLGRSSNAKNAWNLKMWRTEGRTDRPRLKIKYVNQTNDVFCFQSSIYFVKIFRMVFVSSLCKIFSPRKKKTYIKTKDILPFWSSRVLLEKLFSIYHILNRGLSSLILSWVGPHFLDPSRDNSNHRLGHVRRILTFHLPSRK